MIFERIEAQGLAHFSYLIGDGNEAVVIDPRRDCDVYIERAAQAGMCIAHILETHRHEDFLTGSLELFSRTGAEIWHADGELSYRFGQPIDGEQIWRIGRLQLQAFSTPGHTPGSVSYLLKDPTGAPWVVFTGDALFAGEVGRVDLMGPATIGEAAGQLFDSLFNVLLRLGDEVIVCPAHGAGSACGPRIAARSWTTIGLERHLNPRLQLSRRDDFIAALERPLERPPYFERMAELNIQGPSPLGTVPPPRPLTPHEFYQQARTAFVVDTRLELSFNAAHVPRALSIWREGLPSLAGWYLPYETPMLLVTEGEDPAPSCRHLLRMGFDNITGYLAGGMQAWHQAGLESSSIEMVTVQKFCHLLDQQQQPWILDVRSSEELTAGTIPGAHHIHITQLPQQQGTLPRDQRLYIFCGSGLRSTVAASYLQKAGWQQLTVILGGTAGWNSAACPLEGARQQVA